VLITSGITCKISSDGISIEISGIIGISGLIVSVNDSTTSEIVIDGLTTITGGWSRRNIVYCAVAGIVVLDRCGVGVNQREIETISINPAFTDSNIVIVKRGA